jgi:hypothetical protein
VSECVRSNVLLLQNSEDEFSDELDEFEESGEEKPTKRVSVCCDV